MATRRDARIADRDGALGWLHTVDVEDEAHPIAVIRLGSGSLIEVPFESLQRAQDDGYLFPGRWSDFATRREELASIPVIAEKVTVEVREAPAQQVRVRRRVVRGEQVVETPVWEEHIEVNHVPVNAYVDQPPAPRREGDVLIIPCVEEVVEKRLRVREELHVRVVREQRVHRETVEVRRHEIEIEFNPIKNRGD